ncbi:MAG: hypothetical protein KatS3mg002_0325 [Candidatus Woesearchaeota archaeon]|nr:MAG: hypothetical protein KatS3mg002_0325 [Candidatus Woesearchaeota archaeon]
MNFELEKVKCELCGKYFKQITQNHLLKEHDTTIAEYREVFPNSPIRVIKKVNKDEDGSENKIEEPKEEIKTITPKMNLTSIQDIKSAIENKFNSEVVIGYAHDKYLNQDYDFFFIVDFSIPKRKIAIDLLYHSNHKRDPREHLKEHNFLACGWTYLSFETYDQFLSWLDKK